MIIMITMKTIVRMKPPSATPPAIPAFLLGPIKLIRSSIIYILVTNAAVQVSKCDITPTRF